MQTVLYESHAFIEIYLFDVSQMKMHKLNPTLYKKKIRIPQFVENGKCPPQLAPMGVTDY